MGLKYKLSFLKDGKWKSIYDSLMQIFQPSVNYCLCQRNHYIQQLKPYKRHFWIRLERHHCPLIAGLHNDVLAGTERHESPCPSYVAWSLAPQTISGVTSQITITGHRHRYGDGKAVIVWELPKGDVETGSEQMLLGKWRWQTLGTGSRPNLSS